MMSNAVACSAESRDQWRPDTVPSGPKLDLELYQRLRINMLEQELERHREIHAQQSQLLRAILDSHGWKLLLRYYAIRNYLLPPRSRRWFLARAAAHWGLRTWCRLKAWLTRTVGPAASGDYAVWIAKNEPNAWDLRRQRRAAATAQGPRISIVVPIYNTPARFLRDMVRSVQAQTYPHWELCLADGGSQASWIKPMLRRWARGDRRIKVRFLDQNLGISGNSNAALALATGDFVAFLDHDDILAPFALYEVAQAIEREPTADVIYSDEDKIDHSGRMRFTPHFKPDWSPDFLRSYNYICHLLVVRRRLVCELGGLRSEYDGAQDYDLVLRATEQARAIVHIPKVLYHWRAHPESVAHDPAAKMFAYEAGRQALVEHLKRLGLSGSVRHGAHLGLYQVSYDIIHQPLISIIIPNHNHADVLYRCLHSIERSSYRHYEIIIIENHSSEPEVFELYAQLRTDPRYRILIWKPPFNYSAVNNWAAAHAAGEVLLFLNNDVEVINHDWLERMLEHAQQPEVGAVGAKLYFPNDTVQHGGILLGFAGSAGHWHLGFPRNSYGYFSRLVTTQNVAGCTGACLMMRKSVFEEAGRFDERFMITYNDIDLCMKIRQRGYRIVWTPHAELYHYESTTRGIDQEDPIKQARLHSEGSLFVSRWKDALEAGDPYYSPNLDINDYNFRFRC
ncbi:MAG: glycosyltransferase family 2 protein [Gemmataceae bacterium]|nr:glycosyltransferase family 2 protein [Gemmataceae bacterium]MDW8267387.1 glycosyltransferase family 2 protein [Gemmataceae bacterium]